MYSIKRVGKLINQKFRFLYQSTHPNTIEIIYYYQKQELKWVFLLFFAIYATAR